MKQIFSNTVVFIVILIYSPMAVAKVDEDANIWGSVNVKKRITKDFWVTGRTEYWSREGLQTTDQWFARVFAIYQIMDWVNIGVGYDYMQTHSAENASRNYYQPKNNILLQSTLSVPVNDFRLSFRQRYTRGRLSSCNGKDRDFSNSMRSKFIVKYIIPDSCISPFVADELFYWGKMTQNRADIGFSFRLNANNSIDVFYRRQSKFNPDHRNNNILGIDYHFSF